MLSSSLRHIIFASLASLLMNRAVSQPKVSDFLAASATYKSVVKKGNAKLPQAFVMQNEVGLSYKITTPKPHFNMQANNYMATLAWTCRQELRLEKLLTIPLKISLGSKEQVDMLEGKNRSPW